MSITVSASPNESGAYVSLSVKRTYGANCPVKTFAEGCVVSLREANYYDDSDFYATYFNAETGKFEEVCYASTRGWTYHCGAFVDATPEVMAKWEAKCAEEAKAYRERVAEREAATVRTGKTVKVVAGRKVPVGSVWQVLYVCASKFGGFSAKLGNAAAETVWTNVSNLEVVR